MDMYEGNYMQLRLLCGDIRRLPREVVSHAEGGLPVLLRVEESSRHTSLLLLTYVFKCPDGEEFRPDMRIRVYHDAKLAEVVSHRCRFAAALAPPWSADLDNMLLCRWRMNRFLYKWGRYLRRQGHRFG